MLSRLPAGPDSTFDTTQSLNAVVNMIQDEEFENLPIQTADIQEATKVSIKMYKHILTIDMT